MISYIGGKSRIAKFIIPYIPKDIEIFSEAMSGMFWVFLKMNLDDYPKLKTVVYNDYNKLNANLFRCVKDCDKLWYELSKYPCQQLGVENTPPEYKQMFNQYQKEVFDENLIITEKNMFDVACKYVYVISQVFSGSRPETSSYTDYKGKYRCKVLVFMDKLKSPEYRKHFDKITFIENMDFEDCMYKYDSPNTYFYIDPPYYKTEKYYSAHDFGIADHERLAKVLQNIKGKFALSYYEFPQLHKWYPLYVEGIKPNGQMTLFEPSKYTWKWKTFKKAASSKKDGTQNEGIELLIMNYKLLI